MTPFAENGSPLDDLYRLGSGLSSTGASGARSLLSQYGRLQMLVVSRLVSILAVFWLVTFVIFALIRLFTGVSIKRIGYLSLRHIWLSPHKGVEVSIGKLGVSLHRPTVAQPGWVTFILLNCEVKVDTEVMFSTASTSRRHGDAKSSDLGFDPSIAALRGIPIIVSSRRSVLFVARWVAKHLKMFDIVVKSASITYTGLLTLVFTQGSVRLDLRNAPNLRSSNFVGTLDTYQLGRDETPFTAKINVGDTYAAQSLDDENPHHVLENFVIDVNGVLNLTEMRIKELDVMLGSQRISVQVASLASLLKSVREQRVKFADPEVNEEVSVFSEKDKRRIIALGIMAVYLLRRIQIKLGLIELMRVPLVGANFAVSMKDAIIDLSRMNPRSPGFKLLWDRSDVAHQAIFAVASINVGLDSGAIQEELLYIPLVTCLSRGNIFSKTLRYFQGDGVDRNEGMVRSHWSVHSPTVNIEERNLHVLVAIADDWSSKTAHHATHVEEPDTPSGRRQFKIRVPFQNLLPRTDVMLTMTELAFRMVVGEDAMFTLGCQRTHSIVTSRHLPGFNDQDMYLVDASTDIANAQLWYRSDVTPRFDLMALESLMLKAHVETQPELSVEVEVNVNGLQITMMKFELFDQIRKLIVSLRQSRHVNRLKGLQSGFEQAPKSPSQQTHSGRHVGALRKLPPWLRQARLVSSDAFAAIASDRFRNQTSELLGPKIAASRLVLMYERGAGGGHDGTDGRKILLCGENICLYKVDSVFWAHHLTDENLQQANRVLDAPSVKFEIQTKTDAKGQRITETHGELPSAVYSLNINLLLAVMVIHEMVDHALGRDAQDIDEEAEIYEDTKLSQQSDKIEYAPDENSERHNAEKEGIPSDVNPTANTAASSEKDPAALEGVTNETELSPEEYTVSVKMINIRLKLDLPSNDKVMLELIRCHISREPHSNPTLTADALRFYARHPFHPPAWCILVSMVNPHVEVAMARKTAAGTDRIHFDIASLRINVPYKFKLYRIIDNSITLAKAWRTLIIQTETRNTDFVLDPHQISKLPLLPRIHVKSKALLLTLEDDYFEGDLSLILRTNLIEGSSRRSLLRVFVRRLKQSLTRELEDGKKGKGLLAVISPKESSQNGSKAGSVSDSGTGHSTAASTTRDDATLRPSQSSGIMHEIQHSMEHAAHNTSDATQSVGKLMHSATKTAVASANAVRAHAHIHGHRHTNSDHKRGDINEDRLSAHKRQVKHVMWLRQKIEALLTTPFEVGIDNAEASIQESHPWLEFWASSKFECIRNGVRMSPVNATDDEHDLRLAHLFDNVHDDRELVKDRDLQDGCEADSEFPTLEQAAHRLKRYFSDSWIRTINSARKEQHQGAEKTMSDVAPEKLDPKTCKEEMMVDYSQKPLLFNACLRDVDLVIDKTSKGTSEGVHQFMHDVGKGLPLDTAFSIWIPMYLDLRAHGGLRVNLLDYPLPVLHFPSLARNQDPEKDCALRMHGDLVITEELVSDKRNIRRLFVPLKRLPRSESNHRSNDVIEVHRTLAPIKTYTDLKFRAESELPTRVTWCNSYKPGFHGVGMGFSGFSKPPLDLSPKLGFWDKIRLVLHARLDFKLPKSTLYLFLKGGRDPYTLLNSDAGFAFVWRDDVHVQMNPDDDPKNLIVVDSNVFDTVVPDFMAAENEYLHRSPAQRAFPSRTNYTALQRTGKKVFSFGNAPQWKLGMMFEKNSKGHERDSKFRHHYDVRLSMPEYVEDYDNYDAYKGFRSDYLFMAIGVVGHGLREDVDSDTEVFNSAHLTHNVITHFQSWEQQFRGTAFPRIRSGSLYPEPTLISNRALAPKPAPAGFGATLSGMQFQIALSPLSLSFFYALRDHRNALQSHNRCTGLKARADQFVFDLHLRREPQEGSKRWRMHAFLGEVDIHNLDLRAIDVKFTQSAATRAQMQELKEYDSSFMSDSASSVDGSGSGSTSGHASSSRGGPSGATSSTAYTGHKYGPRYVNAEDWIDMCDYQDLGHRAFVDGIPSVRVHPFVFAPRFSYFRHTDSSARAVYDGGPIARKFGSEVAHECLLSAHHPENIQAQLILARQSELGERLKDFETSLESLRYSAEAGPGVELKARQLEILIKLGKDASETLDRAVWACDDRLKSNEDRQRRILEKAREEDHSALAEHRHVHYAKLDDPLENVSPGLKDEMFGPIEVFTRSPEEEEELTRANEEARARAEAAGDGPLYQYKEDQSPEDMLNMFDNRFVLHSMHVKWNDSVRNLLYRLQISLQEEKEIGYNSRQPAVRYLQELIAKVEAFRQEQDNPESPVSEDVLSPADIQEQFMDSKEKTGGDQEKYECKLEKIQTSVSVNEDSEAFNTRLRKFFHSLVTVQDEEIETVKKSYSVVLFTPQIQFISEKNPTKCAVVVARSVETQLISVIDKTSNTSSESDEIDKRYGILLEETGCYVLGEEDINQIGVAELCLEPLFSMDEKEREQNWPPWTALELCYDYKALVNFSIFEKANVAIRFDQPNDLHVEGRREDQQSQLKRLASHTSHISRATHTSNKYRANEAASLAPENSEADSEKSSLAEESDEADVAAGVSDENEAGLKTHDLCNEAHTTCARLTVDAPRLKVRMDSVQAFTAYMIGVDLMAYKDPVVKQREEAIDRVVFATDFTGDFTSSLETVLNLQKDVRLVQEFHQVLMTRFFEDASPQVKVAIVKLEREGRKATLELLVLMRAFKAGLRKAMDTDTDRISKWSILIGEVGLSILGETGHPLIDFKLGHVHYTRVRSGDQFTINRATVRKIAGRNCLDGAVYPDVVETLPPHPGPEENSFLLLWRSLDPVGGISILENVNVDMKPMHIQLEQKIVDKLMDFAFPIKESRKNHSSDDDKGSTDEDEALDSSSDSDSDDSSETKASPRKDRSSFKKRISKLFGASNHQNSEISEMVTRASAYMNILQFTINSTRLSLSYKGRSSHNLLDLQDVNIILPTISYSNKMWTKLDLVMRLKHDVMKILLRQAGSILGNRFIRHKDRSGNSHGHLITSGVREKQDWEIVLVPEHRIKAGEKEEGGRSTPSKLRISSTQKLPPGSQTSPSKIPAHVSSQLSATTTGVESARSSLDALRIPTARLNHASATSSGLTSTSSGNVHARPSSVSRTGSMSSRTSSSKQSSSRNTSKPKFFDKLKHALE